MDIQRARQRRHAILTLKVFALLVVAGLLLWAMPMNALAGPRTVIRMVGSSTMFRMSSYVAEQFGRTRQFATPIVESTGTGGGFKQFCGGISDQYPDILAASRPITESERQSCARHDVEQVVELEVGTGGLLVVNSDRAPMLNLTSHALWRAIAEKIPVDGKLVGNPYKTWDQVDPILPKLPILVYGPPPTSGTRDALVGMVFEPACATEPLIQALPADQRRDICYRVREDGAYVDAGESDDSMLRRVAANPKAVGIIGFHAVVEDPSIQASPVDGISPNVVSIMSGHYPLVRNLYIYVKGDNLDRIPGLADFVQLYTSDRMIGQNGELVDNGLVPLPDGVRDATQAKVGKLILSNH